MQSYNIKKIHLGFTICVIFLLGVPSLSISQVPVPRAGPRRAIPPPPPSFSSDKSYATGIHAQLI